MAKQVYKAFDRKTVGQSHIYLDQLPREADGIYNMYFDTNGRLIKRAGFTKHNTTSLSAATTVDADSTAKVLNVTATTGFVVGNSVIINTGGVREETKVIDSIQDTVSLTMTENLTYTHTAVQSDAVEALFGITGLFRFYKINTSTKYTLAVCDTFLYKLANTDPWAGGTPIKTGLTSEANMYFASFYNHCYMCNDENGLFKFGYNTTAIRTVGITAPAAKPSGVAQGSGGSLGAGDYKYCYTYVDEDGYESDPSPVSVAVTCVADDSVVLTIVNSDDAKVVSRNIYRTAVGGALYYYDGEVADNTTPTYTSIKLDITLGTIVSTEHDTPPTSPQLIASRNNRIYVGSDDDLCISALTYVEYFPSGWFQKTTDRRKITGIAEQKSNLIVFTEDVINVLSGTSEDNFIFKKTYAGDGCIAPRSIQTLSNHIVFLSFNGLMAFNGHETAEIDARLNKYLRDNINYAYANTSCSVYYEDKYILSYPKGSATYPTESVYFDYRTGKTGVFDFAFNVFSRWDKGDDGILIKGGSTTIGRVYNLFTGLDDDGSAIECYDDIMPMDFGLPEVEKNYYDIYVKVRTTTGTALRVYYTIDDNTETYAEPATGEGLIADKERWYRVRLPSSVRGREIAIRPRMNDKYQAEFQGYIIVYDTEALRV